MAEISLDDAFESINNIDEKVKLTKISFFTFIIKKIVTKYQKYLTKCKINLTICKIFLIFECDFCAIS